MTPECDKVNILVVDDLVENVLVLRSILEVLGENVVSAYSGREALRQVLHHDFAVILLDVNMPDIDGFETAALIRQRKKSAHTPIILVTAYADEIQTSRGYSTGAVDYILAPVAPEILRMKVKVFVELFRLNQQIKLQAEERIALAREQAARAVAEVATRRSTFLAEVGKVLVSSLDVGQTLSSLPQLAVPFLADLSSVTQIGPDDTLGRTELSWRSSLGEILYATLPDHQRLPGVLLEAVVGVFASGRQQLLTNLDVEFPCACPEGCVPNGRPHSAESGFIAHDLLVLPLLAHGRTLGIMALALGRSGRNFESADLTLAQEFASRAAMALDNGRLYLGIQEADRHKNEFLSMLAHELRNPLAPIRNAAAVLRMRKFDDPALNAARDMIDRQVTHMTRVIDDLLDMSRIARGKMLLRTEILDLGPLVQEVVEDYRIGMEAGGITLNLRLPRKPVWVLGDPTRLAQVVGNVLHNAGKFTDSGGEVWVELAPEPDQRMVRLTIRDTGIGMEPDMLKRVFDTFSQADQSLNRNHGGLGMGLALVKGLVTMHMGEVCADSEGLGKGAEFTIRLPLEEKAPSKEEFDLPANMNPAAYKILLIEDNIDAAESMRMLLSLTGHDVQVAFSGPVGVETAQTFLPEVVLCDIGLPGGMDGYAVARALRKDATLTSAYLIALSGYGQESDRRRSREAGFDTHLIKPVEFDELQLVLASVNART